MRLDKPYCNICDANITNCLPLLLLLGQQAEAASTRGIAQKAKAECEQGSPSGTAQRLRASIGDMSSPASGFYSLKCACVMVAREGCSAALVGRPSWLLPAGGSVALLKLAGSGAGTGGGAPAGAQLSVQLSSCSLL